MKLILVACMVLLPLIALAQSTEKLVLKGDYSMKDSIAITTAYLTANTAVNEMYNAMSTIWHVDELSENSKKHQRAENWRANKDFMIWLGEPTHIHKAYKKIKKINSKFNKPFILEVIKNNEGRCGRFVSAWAVPYGKVKIRLCRNFVNFDTKNQSKTIIHELAHEAGLLFDRGVYRCGAAKSVAANKNKNRAAKRPENYAWLAMNYLGFGCVSR